MVGNGGSCGNNARRGADEIISEIRLAPAGQARRIRRAARAIKSWRAQRTYRGGRAIVVNIADAATGTTLRAHGSVLRRSESRAGNGVVIRSVNGVRIGREIKRTAWRAIVITWRGACSIIENFYISKIA
jgi:hypothetical protein